MVIFRINNRNRKMEKHFQSHSGYRFEAIFILFLSNKAILIQCLLRNIRKLEGLEKLRDKNIFEAETEPNIPNSYKKRVYYAKIESPIFFQNLGGLCSIVHPSFGSSVCLQCFFKHNGFVVSCYRLVI